MPAINKKPPSKNQPSNKAPAPPAHVVERWLTAQTADVGGHDLSMLSEIEGARPGILDELRKTVQDHYVAPEITAQRLADLGAPKTSALFKEHLPTTKTARSGDMGEILATEISECRLGYKVPVRRLRWKDGRNMPLRGDDIIGVVRGRTSKIQFLKGEAKSRAALATTVIDEAAESLDSEEGRPTRHAVLFVAERLRDQGTDDLPKELEEAVLQSFRGYVVEHLLFVLSGNDPQNLLSAHLTACAKRPRRHAVGVRIKDHGKFIEELFGGL